VVVIVIVIVIEILSNISIETTRRLGGRMQDKDFGADTHVVMRAIDRAAERIAGSLLAVNLGITRQRQEVWTDGRVEPTEDLKAQICRSPAYSQLRLLAANAYKQKGLDGVSRVLSAAADFYHANGMPYRQLERQHAQFGYQHKQQISSKPDAAFRNEEALRSMCLWLTPSLTPEAGTLGPNSMIGADQVVLRQAAESYFASDVRCQWFEKMLVEAFVAAEVHATGLEVRKNPALTLGPGLWRAIIWALVFQKSRGESPRYEFMLWGATILFWVVAFAALAGFAFYSSVQVENGREILGYLGLGFVGLVSVNWAGRYLTRRIASWASVPLNTDPAGIGKILVAMSSAKAIALAPAMNLNMARSILTHASLHGVMLAQIAFGLIDRGIAAGEIMWFNTTIWNSPDDWDDMLLGDDDPEDAGDG
jgi:hypothetical protein